MANRTNIGQGVETWRLWAALALMPCLALALPPLAHAGGWPREKGELYLQQAYTYMAANKLFNGTKHSFQLRRTVHDATIDTYAEYGLANRWTAIAVLPLKFTATGGGIHPDAYLPDTLASGSLVFFGNLRWGLRCNIFNADGMVLSVQGMAEAPTGKSDAATGLQTGYNAWGWHTALQFGWGGNRRYFSLDGGIDVRANNHSEKVLAQAEYGLQLKKRPIWLIWVLACQISLRNGSHPDGNILHTGLYANEQEHASYGMKTIVPLGKKRLFGINAALFGSFYGRYVQRAPAFTFGIYYKGKPRG